jgi:methylthioribose-1-phosphate isomerase
MIGKNGATLINKKSKVMTHCNAGALATAGYGTAVGVIRKAFEDGKIDLVYVNETRPYLQGARLTAWELMKYKIPFYLITDNMAGYIMKKEKVDCIIVGADRIAANGDTANKIGTYSLAVLAHYHKIPFYIAAPSSTFDLSIKCGDDIPIEYRSEDEVKKIFDKLIAPAQIKALHPAFDVTPNKLISAIITEKGILYKPFTTSINKLIK